MAKKRITDITNEILKDYLPQNGYSLYHSEFVKEGRDWFLRIYVDNDNGPMSTQDCEMISRYLSDKLDESDPIEQNYYLVVSSPGLDRELVTKEHFEKYIGYDVDLKMYRAVDGEKTISGKLLSFDGNSVEIDRDGEKLTFPKKEIARTRLTVII
jgi:ribosome maturation factor RimP